MRVVPRGGGDFMTNATGGRQAHAVWMSAHVYRSIGPLIAFRVYSDDCPYEEQDMDVYFWPGQTFRFAVHLIWLCGYAVLFRLRLVLRDWGWKF